MEADQDKVLEELGFADGILFGTPTIVGEALKPIWDLTTSIFAGHTAESWQAPLEATDGAAREFLILSRD